MRECQVPDAEPTEKTEDRRNHGPALERRNFNPGDRVFREGEAGDCAYLVESGLLEISKEADNDVIVIGTIGKGAMVGEMALINDTGRSATVRVIEHAVLAVIPRETFTERLEKVDPVIRQVLKLLSGRLRDQTIKTAKKAYVVR